MAIKMHKIVMKRKKSVNMIRWLPPKETFGKLNVDGVCGDDGITGCEGVFLDAHGGWIYGFRVSRHV